MSGHHRFAVAALILGAVLVMAVLVAFAGSACPAPTEDDPCPEASRNIVVVLALASSGAALLVTPFAFLAEFVVRRRIVYRGAWWRAARRGILAGALVATLAGLRLGNALTVPVALFLFVLVVLIERFLAARDA